MEDTAKQEILEAIQAFAAQVDQRFNHLEAEFGSQQRDIGSRRSDIGSLKFEVGSMKSHMVTKSYLDDKMSDLRGDLVALAKKSNTKLSVTIEQLVIEGSLKRDIADRILSLEPFPIAG
ncbi:MAG TPA: hypothetical protein VN397_02410 [Candidatus Methylomirabilis sp.]|nr:hypothetical protein [Candidatus Methylomirabilis sp.]